MLICFQRVSILTGSSYNASGFTPLLQPPASPALSPTVVLTVPTEVGFRLKGSKNRYLQYHMLGLAQVAMHAATL